MLTSSATPPDAVPNGAPAPLVAGTHDGSMHADEIIAGALLSLAEPGVTFVRSRDPEILRHLPILFDVGGKYDPKSGRYDHHQPGAPKRPTGEPYSSAGLIWKAYSHRFPQAHLYAVERDLIEPIDLMDNGRSCPAYVPGGALPSLLSAYNTNWNEPVEDMGVRYLEAVALMRDGIAEALAGKPVIDVVKGVSDRMAPRLQKRLQAREAAREVLAPHLANLGDSPILNLPVSLPWSELIDPADYPKLRYVVVPGRGKEWIARSLPVKKSSFYSQAPFPANWRGLERKALQRVTMVPDAIFCHASGFCAIARSEAGAKRLAELSLIITKGITMPRDDGGLRQVARAEMLAEAGAPVAAPTP